MCCQHGGEGPRRSGHCRRRTRALLMGVCGSHCGSLFVWWKLVATFCMVEVSGYFLYGGSM